jgi:hypothetical protein
MMAHARFWGLPFIEFVLPGLVSFALFAFGHPVSFPLSQASTAVEIFPKLASEQAVISQIYSPQTALNYTLTYANSFLLGGIFLVVALLLELALRKLNSSGTQHDEKGTTYSFETSEPGQESRIRTLLGIVLLILALSYFSFYLPIAFMPTPGVSETRAINSLYGAFILAFPVLFTLTYFLSLSALNQILPLSTTTKE